MENKIKAYISQLGWKENSDKTKILEQLSRSSKNIDLLLISTKLSHQTLTARLSDLEDAGLVVKILTQGRYSIYRISQYSEIEKVAKKRENERFQRWLKLGEKKGWINNGNVCC